MKAGSVTRLAQSPDMDQSTGALSSIELHPTESSASDRHLELADRDATEQATRAQPENSGDDQNGDGSSVGNED